MQKYEIFGNQASILVDGANFIGNSGEENKVFMQRHEKISH